MLMLGVDLWNLNLLLASCNCLFVFLKDFLCILYELNDALFPHGGPNAHGSFLACMYKECRSNHVTQDSQ
jgi:hypothetical protein